MATITPQAVTASGTALTLAAATSGGDSVHNARGATLVVSNGDASSHSVTFTGVVECTQGGLHDVTVAVAAGATEHIPVPSQAIDPATGNAAITWTAVTSVTVGAYL